jgi:hypothetical protein
MDVLQTLKSERENLQRQLHRLNAAIHALSGGTNAGRATTRKRPVLSAAARARIAAAQRARWAKIRAKKGAKAG